MKSVRHLITVADLTGEDLTYLVDRSIHFSTAHQTCEKTLENKIIGVYFKKTSTRTRTGFSAGALKLGANIIQYGPNDLQLNTGESLIDTRDIFSQMLNCLVSRTAEAQEEFEMLADQPDMAVINAMSAEEHPTQAVTDLSVMKRYFGRLEGLKILYVGEGNNTAAALALAVTKFTNCRIEFRTPEGYGLTKITREKSMQNATASGCEITEHHHMQNLPGDFDVVYTTRWQTTGTTKPDPNWRNVFQPFQVNDALMANWPEAVFMHDLPAHREEEVTASVLDGSRSIAFRQAAFKLFSAMAILEWCLVGKIE